MKAFVPYLELTPVDGFSATAIALGEVTALKHEVRDDAVEGAALIRQVFPT